MAVVVVVVDTVDDDIIVVMIDDVDDEDVDGYIDYCYYLIKNRCCRYRQNNLFDVDAAAAEDDSDCKF